MIELEIVKDEIYYWIVFTTISSAFAVLGAIAFVISYKVMTCLRKKRLYRKACHEYYQSKLNPEQNSV